MEIRIKALTKIFPGDPKKNIRATKITSAPTATTYDSEAMPALMVKCALIQPSMAGPIAPITAPPKPNTPTAAAR